MASVLTDQFIPGSVVAPLLGLLTTPKVPQFNAVALTTKNIGRTGNVTVLVPAPAISTAFVARRYRVTFQGTIQTGTTMNVGSSINIVDTAGTSTIIATYTNAAVNTTTASFSLSAELILDPSTAAISGNKGGWINQTYNVIAALTAAPTVVFTGSGAVQFGITFTGSVADATAIVTVQEVTLELL